MPDLPQSSRVVPRINEPRVRRIGLRSPWYRDAYHRALTMPWPLFALAGSLVYILVNVIFAGFYLLQPGSIAGARPDSAEDAFFFSVQCLSTIGFGSLTPATLYANCLTTLEAMVSVALTALAAGSVFARISRPRARVMFARSAVVGLYNGVPTLSFRIANERLSQILEANVAVSLLRWEETREGDSFRRFYDLKLARSHTPVFALSFTVMHPIDAESPLYAFDPAAFAAEDAELLVTVTGLEEASSQTVHARYSYRSEEIAWNSRFADIFKVGADGRRYIDYGRFHEVEPAAAAASLPG